VPENIVTADISMIKNFVETHSKAVIKPLNMCFGSGVFCLDKDDINLNTIIKTATKNGSNLVMVQKYLESAKFGDKRVLLLGDEVLEQAVIKAPLKNDFKFSEHSDEFLKKATLSDKERKLCKVVAQKLNSMGLYMVGLDLIEEQIIEINVTSPCFFIKEINNLFGVKLEDKLVDYFESKFPKR
jgi:glutathione synthase